MHVLITGGAGFIGSHLVDYYLGRSDTVTVVDNLITGRIDNIRRQLDNPRLRLIVDSILNRATLEGLVRDADIVYNLAAPVGVKFIMNRPVHTLLDNVRGIDVVLEYCNKYRRKVLVASSSEVYGMNMEYLTKKKQDKLDEDALRLMGSTRNHRWAYANTKAFDEFLAFAYQKEYGLPVVVVRFFNIIGPRQTGDYGMVVPSFVKSALAGDPVTIYGTGSQSRTFMYVADAIEAIKRLMETPAAAGDVFNVGGTDEITIAGLAEKIISLARSKSKIKYIDYQAAYGSGFEDMMRRTPCIDKLKRVTGFEPRYNLDKMLTEIIKTMKTEVSSPES